MADKTKIEWTDATWNPITGCSRASEGCRHCYAALLAATRLKHHPSREGLAAIDGKGEAKFNGQVRFNEQWLADPLKWRRPRMVFVCAHADLFHENVPDAWIDRVFAVMALAPQHNFQVLTKRSARMWEYLADPERREAIVAQTFFLKESPDLAIQWPLPNVWLGVSVEDQAAADARIPDLLATPAAVRWLNCEPLLGELDLTRVDDGCAHREVPREEWGPVDDEDSPPALWWDTLTGERTIMHGGAYGDWSRTDASLDWVVCGGESGKGARPMHPDWARSLRDQCADAGVPFFFKQWGAHRPTSDSKHGEYMIPASKAEAGRQLDGKFHNAMPDIFA